MSSTTPPPPIPQLEVGTYFGPPLIGLLIATFLSGLLFLQVFLYFLRYPNDRLWIKIFVGGLFVFDMAHLISLCHYVYYFLVTNWGNWIPVISVPIVASFGIEIILGSFITSAVQAFFLYRIYVLSRHKWWLIVLPTIISCIALSFGTWLAVLTMTGSISPNYIVLVQRLPIVWLSMSAAADLIIALLLCFYLHTLNNTIRKRFMNRLITYSINTGLTTAIIAFVDLSFCVTSTTTQVHTAFNFPLCRIYSNSLLASLNSRESVVDSRDKSWAVNVSDTLPSQAPTSRDTGSIPRHNIAVAVKNSVTDTYEMQSLNDPESALYSGTNTMIIDERPSKHGGLVAAY